MLAILSTNTLSLLDPAILKRAPSSAPHCLSVTDKPIASAWSSDNAFLFIASTDTIHQYDPSTNSLKVAFSDPESENISNLLSKDKCSLIYSAANKVHVVECGSTPKISQTLESHKTAITSLSLSNDLSLLASTSATMVHVHNLSLGSHTVLRGLPLAGQTITTSVFHPHSRTRLLLAIGKQLVIYDTTRPSGPMKTIALNESTLGDIAAVACSPFSKTLVAVATTGGSVGLVDLDKEKGLFRTINLKVPLTSLAFSPEGAAIYMGTENGRLLIMDLRALEKPPKSIIISDTGDRIETMSIQKKVKNGVNSTAKVANTGTTTTKILGQPENNPLRRPSTQAQQLKQAPKPTSSPARARITRAGSGPSPARRLPSANKGVPAVGSPLKTGSVSIETKKKVFSPVRDPLGNSGSAGDISVEIDSIGAMKAAAKMTPLKSNSTTSASRSPKSISATSKTSVKTSRTAPRDEEAPRRARTVPVAPRTRKTSTTDTASASNVVKHTVPEAAPSHSPESHRDTNPQPRTTSATSRRASDSVSVRTARTGSTVSRPGSSISRAGSSNIGSPPPVSRTPSPDFPNIQNEPITPVPAGKKGFGVLGLGTPEVDQWIKAGEGRNRNVDKGKGKAKIVGFMKDDESEPEEEDEINDEKERERERSLTMQISPRRPGASSSTSWAPSPVRHPAPGSPAGVGGPAYDLLRTIVQDVMFDFQRETKAEMTGLHLDLVRMGRGWKQELRDLMDEYVGDLKDLREENRRLREENDMLRGGGY